MILTFGTKVHNKYEFAIMTMYWKHNDKISLQQNSCPHRCAPLSEGYITPQGNLACSYHGWSFNNNGT